jgi:hypothetical protein
MLTRNNRIACDECGRFISYTDLEKGTARHVLSTPDSHFSVETYESQCVRCRARKEAA